MSLMLAGILAVPAFAQPEGSEDGGPPPSDPTMKQKLLDNFDTNKDGTLDREERRAIGRGIWENFGGGPGRSDEPPRDRGPRGEGRRGPRPDGPPDAERRGPGPGGPGPEGRRGPGGPDGPPPGPPNPNRLFNRFDEDEDGSLSKEEFQNLAGFVHERFVVHPRMMGRGGPDFEHRGGRPWGEHRGRWPGEGSRGRWREDGPPRAPRGPDAPLPPADVPPVEDPV